MSIVSWSQSHNVTIDKINYKKIIVMAKQTDKNNNNKNDMFCRSSTISTGSTGSTGTDDTSNGGMRLLRIAVGTTNPCKIDAVTKAIKQSIESTTGSIDNVDVDVQGFSVDSGVPDQPFGDVRVVCYVFCSVCFLFLLLSLYCTNCTNSHVPLSSLLFSIHFNRNKQ
jgi:hypothetical protein